MGLKTAPVKILLLGFFVSSCSVCGEALSVKHTQRAPHRPVCRCCVFRVRQDAGKQRAVLGGACHRILGTNRMQPPRSCSGPAVSSARIRPGGDAEPVCPSCSPPPGENRTLCSFFAPSQVQNCTIPRSAPDNPSPFPPRRVGARCTSSLLTRRGIAAVNQPGKQLRFGRQLRQGSSNGVRGATGVFLPPPRSDSYSDRESSGNPFSNDDLDSINDDEDEAPKAFKDRSEGKRTGAPHSLRCAAQVYEP